MKVLSLVPDAYGGRGGIALYCRNVLAAMCDAGASVIAVPRVAAGPVSDVPAGLDFRTAALQSKARFVFEALRAAREHDPDVILCSHANLLPVAHLARGLTGAPVVLFVYGVEAWTPRRALVNRLVPTIDALVSIRPLTTQRLVAWSGLPAGAPRFHLPNAIHLERYGARSAPAELTRRLDCEGKPVLVTLSRQDSPDFGVDEVLQVLPGLLEDIPQLVYVVIGDGPQLARLKAKARSLGVAQRVRFAGAVSEAEKADHYRLGQAFTMAGSNPRFDRYPLRFVFLEAMACGLPVVAAQPEEPLEGVVDGLPLTFVDPRDPGALRGALAQALGRGAGAPAGAMQRVAYPAFRERLEEIVRGVQPRQRSRLALLLGR